jgi:hypothetical protein
MSDNLRKVVLDITIFNAPVKAPLIAQGFGAIVEKITEINARFDSLAAAKKLSPLSDDDAKLVVESLTTVVKVHQALLSTVIGKQGLLPGAHPRRARGARGRRRHLRIQPHRHHPHAGARRQCPVQLAQRHPVPGHWLLQPQLCHHCKSLDARPEDGQKLLHMYHCCGLAFQSITRVHSQFHGLR